MNIVRVHPIGYDARPHNHHADLFKALAPYLAKRGHAMIDDINHADAITFDSNVWRTVDNCSGPYSHYDEAVLETVVRRHIPIVYFDNFDYYGTDTYHCTWSGKNDWADMLKIPDQQWAQFMYRASRPGNCRVLYFMRKMQVSQTYPDWVFPLEYPLFDSYPMATKDELFNRPNDVCMLCNASQPRLNAAADLLADGRLKCDVCATMGVRIPHDVWVARHRHAKLFVECDASMGSERPQRLMTVAPMLRVRSDHRLPFPREDMIHQVTVGNYDGHIGSMDVDKILSVVNNKDLLFSIYTQGAEHMERYYSMGARCNYVIDTMENFLK